MLACVIARTKYACAETQVKRNNIMVLSFMNKRKIIVLCHLCFLLFSEDLPMPQPMGSQGCEKLWVYNIHKKVPSINFYTLCDKIYRRKKKGKKYSLM